MNAGAGLRELTRLLLLEITPLVSGWIMNPQIALELPFCFFVDSC